MKYIIITCMALALSAAALFFTKSKSQPVGMVIILNGPSAAGKSSVQKEFQYLTMNEGTLWIKLGIDNLFDKPMPDITMENLAYWQSSNPIRWVESTKDALNNPIITLFTGEQGEKIAMGMNSAIAAYAKEGNNVIVDYIAYKKEWIDDLRNKLKNIKTYWVKVEIPLSVLEEREVARGTSPKGHARSHYDTVHWDIKYDLVVNSDIDSAIEIAKQIKNALEQKYMATQEKNLPANFDDIWALGDQATIEKKFVELLDQAQTSNDTSLYLQILSQMALVQALQKKFDTAHKTLDKAVALLAPEYTLAKARILLERGRVYHQAEDLENALKYFKQCYELSSKHHYEYYAIDAAHMIAIVVPINSDKIDWNKRAIKLAEQAQDKKAQQWLGSLYNNLGKSYLDDKQFEPALQAYQKALKYRQNENDSFNTRNAKWAIGHALRLMGKNHDALVLQQTLLQELENIAKEDRFETPALKMFFPLELGLVYEELAEIYYAMKDHLQAKRSAQLAYDALTEHGWMIKIESERLERLKSITSIIQKVAGKSIERIEIKLIER